MPLNRLIIRLLIPLVFFSSLSSQASPLPSWINVKAECGAVGDGKANDTAAIQQGLDLIRPEDSKRKILYFPAGTYRITGTIQAVREKHRESQGIGLQGEGPHQSVIVYDGKGNEPMLRWGAWYSTIRSLGFQPKEVEGGAKPTAGIWFGPGFSTANEVSDCAFRDLPIGIQGGTDQTKGQAEVVIERCLFEGCSYGINLSNWNSLDWWVWDSAFRKCGIGVGNHPGCGNFTVYQSSFDQTMEADIKIGHLGGFSMVENESANSSLFLYVQRGHTAGANLTLQGNCISGARYQEKLPSGVIAEGLSMRVGNPGPVLMCDNQFTRPEGASGADVYFNSANEGSPRGSALLIGNTTTSTKLYENEKRYEVRVVEVVEGGRREVEKEGAGGSLQKGVVTKLPVIEVAAGSGGEEIQKAIDGAEEGQVVHLPAGKYRLSEPIVIKTGIKVTLQGDGLLNATVLVSEGDFGERGLLEVQPGASLEVRDLALQAPVQGGGAVGMIVKTADTEGVKVLGNQVQTTGFGPGLVVEGLDYGRVILRNHGHNGVTVFGGPRAKKGDPVPGRVELLCGASSRDGNLKPETPIYEVRQGGKILVRDIWYEGNPSEFMQVRDRGDIVFVGGHVAPNKGKGHAAVDAIQMDGQAGSVLLAQAALNGADLKIGQLAQGFFVTLFGLTPYPGTGIGYADGDSRISNKGYGISEADKLKTNPISNIPNPVSPKPGEAGFVQLMCRQNNTKITGSEPLPDVNADVDLAERFRILREWKLPDPNLNAPVKLHRVSCTGSIGLVVVRSGPKTK